MHTLQKIKTRNQIVKITNIMMIIVLAGIFLRLCKNGLNNYITQTRSYTEVYYICDTDIRIRAKYLRGLPVKANPGEMPQPNGAVELYISDGRKLILPQTISGSGIRYAKGDESVVFWSKGDTSFMSENNLETITGCRDGRWTLGNIQIDSAVEEYLLTQKRLSWKTDQEGKNFCVFQNLAPERQLFPHYIHVRCGEFNKVNEQLTELSGISVPVKIDYPNELSFYDTDKFRISLPRDGALYRQDLKLIFPPEILSRLDNRPEELNDRLLQKTAEYYKE